jgi:hypothetical protein
MDELDPVFEEVDTRIRSRQFDAAVEAVDRIVTPPNITTSRCERARNILTKLITRRKTKQNGYSGNSSNVGDFLQNKGHPHGDGLFTFKGPLVYLGGLKSVLASQPSAKP